MVTTWEIGLFFLIFVTSTVDAGWLRKHRDGLCDVYNENWSCDNDAAEFLHGGDHRDASSIPLDDRDLCNADFVGTTLALLEEGDEKIELTQNEEAILLIGNTGTGKSTLTYFLAGNNSALISYSVDFYINLIKDCNGKIGDSTIISQTIFPDLVVEEVTNTAFYDNPGFLDTRTPCIEIANAYFINKVVNHVKRVKFVIVVNHVSMTSVAERGEFIRTLNNVLSFIPNLQKFLPSVALVGTKVDSAGKDIYQRVRQMSQFLTTNKPNLHLEFTEPQLTLVNNLFDTFNETNAGGNFTRMNVFRMPEECGPLSDIDHMVENRANIMNIAMNNLKYTESSPSDFGLSLSSDAILKIQEMSRELSKKVAESFVVFADELLEHIRPQFESDCVTGCDLDLLISDLSLLFSNPDFAQDYSDESVWEGLNFTEVVNRLVGPIYFPSGFDLSFDLSESLEKYGRYLDFLNTLQPLSIEISEWFRPLRSFKSNLIQNIRQIATKSNTRAIDLIKEFATVLQNFLKGQLSQENSDFEPVLVSLSAVSSNPDFQSNYDPSAWIGLTFSEIIERFLNPFHLPPLFEIPEGVATGLQNSGSNLDELQKYVTAPPIEIPLIYWSEPLSTFKGQLSTDLTSWSVLINGKTVEAFKNFNSLLTQHFAGASTFECLLDSSCDLLISDLGLLFSNPDFAQDYADEGVWEGLNFSEVIDRITNPEYLPPGFHLSSDLSETFEKFGRYLDFLSTLQPLSIDIYKWYEPLKALKSTLIQNIREGSLQLGEIAKSSLTVLTPFLNTTKLEELRPLGVYEKPEALKSYIIQVEGAVSDLKNELESGATKTHIFVAKVVDKFSQLGLPLDIPPNYSSSLISASEFFESLGHSSFVDGLTAGTWLRPLINFQSQMLMEETWNDFLINLWLDLRTIEYQSENKGGLKTWWQSSNNAVTLVTFSSFWGRFNTTSAIYSRNKGEFTDILETDTKDKLKNLNDLLSTSLGNSFTCKLSSSDTISTVTGNFVTLSDIISKPCLKAGVTKTVAVFANHTIFIDQDVRGVQINGVNNIDLILISPTLWYSTPYKINLDGGPGLLGDSPGGPGKPGGKAGNLISMGQNFVGTIENSAKGGKGGNGAVGAEGAEGAKGAQRPAFTDDPNNDDSYWYPPKSQCEARSGQIQLITSKYPEYTCDDAKIGNWCDADENGVRVTIPGADGQPGSAGGPGGKLGYGGKGGHLYTINVESSSSDNPPVVDGSNGEAGVGGAGGLGGLKGDEMYAQIDDVQRHAEKWCKVTSQGYTAVYYRAQDGQNGVTGGNSTLPQTPLPQNFNPGSIATYFNEYKKSSVWMEPNQFLNRVITDFKYKGDQTLQ